MMRERQKVKEIIKKIVSAKVERFTKPERFCMLEGRKNNLRNH